MSLTRLTKPLKRLVEANGGPLVVRLFPADKKHPYARIAITRKRGKKAFKTVDIYDPYSPLVQGALPLEVTHEPQATGADAGPDAAEAAAAPAAPVHSPTTEGNL